MLGVLRRSPTTTGVSGSGAPGACAMSRGRPGEEADDLLELGFDDDEPFTMVSSQLINDSTLRVPVRFTYIVLRSYKGA